MKMKTQQGKSLRHIKSSLTREIYEVKLLHLKKSERT